MKIPLRKANPQPERRRTARGRSADFQSAVSQNCILLAEHSFQRAENFRRPADCKSAIQQIKNLRYALLRRLPRAIVLLLARLLQRPWIDVSKRRPYRHAN